MRKLSILLAVILSLLLLLTSCFGSNTDKCAKWEPLEEGDAISDGNTVYRKYKELPLNVGVGGINYYFTVTIDDTYCDIFSNSLDSGIKYVTIYGAYTAYVADGTDTSALDSFIDGTPGCIKFYDNNSYTASDVDSSFVSRFDSLCDEPITVNVRELKSAKQYNILYLDATQTLSYIHGTVFEYEGGLYYVNYDNLTNDYFDSHGDFSFFKGTVDLYPVVGDLKDELLQKIADQADSTYDINTYVSELTIYSEVENSVENARKTIAITLGIFGIALPLFLLTLGILHLILKKKQRNYFAYSIIIPSSLWLICGIILMIISL